MISPEHIQYLDTILDEHVSDLYKRQPLGQDWARVSKIAEELGEAVSELILLTGQNPRKPVDDAAYNRMLAELGDVVLTATLAIQHFTKNVGDTEAYIARAQDKAVRRFRELYP